MAQTKRSMREACEDKKDVLDRLRSGSENSDSAMTDDGKLLRTVTILEMSSWDSNPLVGVREGDDDDDDDKDALMMPEEEMHVDKSTKPGVQDVHSYMTRREMTAQQERWNALTMIPSPLYCIYYILAGNWISYSLEGDHEDEEECTRPPIYFCPLPVIFIALAICLHAPFSFLYHYKYAPALPAGLGRTDHWSRRLDQSMIHAASALISYSTSGNWYYFIANFLYNADCMRRQCEKKVHPRRNQVLIAVSMVFYTIPILWRDISLFFECWAIIAVSVWLFARYPLGGWSHSAFHLVIALLPPLVMEAACQLPSSQEAIRMAAKCAANSARPL